MIEFKKNKLKISLLAVFASIFFSFSISSGNVFATVESADNIQKLAVLRGVLNCYKTNAKDEIKQSNFTSFTSIFNQSGNWTTDDVTILPTKVGNTINDWGLSCSETMSGYSGAGGTSTGFKSYYSYPTTLEDSGYYFDHNEGTGDSKSGTADANTDQITIKIESITDSTGGNKKPMTVTGSLVLNGEQKFHDGWWNDYYYWNTTGASGTISVSYEGKEIFNIGYTGGSYAPFIFSEYGVLNRDSMALEMATTGQVNGQSSGSRFTFMAARQLLADYIKEDLNPAVAQYYSSPDIKISIESTAPKADDSGNANSVYKPISNGMNAAEVMFDKVGIDGVPIVEGEINTAAVKASEKYPFWNANYTYGLYYAYLQNAIEEYPDITIGECTKDKPSEAGYYFKGKKDNWCVINIPASADPVKSKQVAIVGSMDLERGTFADVLTWFGDESSYTYVDDDKYAGMESNGDPTNPTNPEDNPDDGEKTEEEKLEEACYKEAKSLGWIICPIIFGLQEVSKGIYQQVEPMIRVNDTVVGQMYQGNSGQGEMFKAWNTFRGIANIIFVILFLFIIFSQLTGIGIDNYGIKKMLPKVIITAILVNISFLICAVAVDVSNVLGKALQDLFTTIAPSGAVLSGDAVQGTLTTIDNAVNIIPLAVGGGIAVGIIGFAMQGWAIIIPILLFLIVMVISIIFALIVLGLRQAFVVILVIVSPIAFACTLLPNTEPVFKKWKEFFKQILMVYPIVGGLIGAGYFVARMILVDKADLIMTITAGMLCVAPYFLVPSLTRKSLAMAGNIGERLAGAGRAARNAGRRANNSQAVRNARERSRDGVTAFGRNGLNALSMKAANWANENSKKGKSKGRRALAWTANHTIASRGRMASVARTNQNRVANSRETAYGQAVNAVAERERLENDGYNARNAGIASEAFNKAVKDYESLITNGEYIGSDGQNIGQNDIDKLEKELVNELTKENADDVKINALTNKLLGNGKKGLRKVDSAYSQALSSGKASSSAIKAFSNNIKNSHPETADMMPSLFESSLVGASSGSLGGRAYEQFNNEGIGSLDAAKMAKLDKTQLGKYLDANGGFASYMTDTSKQQLAALASEALSDPMIKITGDNRPLLEQIARAGNQPVPSSNAGLEGDSGKIHQTTTVVPPAQTEAGQAAAANAATVNASATADAARARAGGNGQHAVEAYTELVNRRVASGDLKAEDGQRLIQSAKDHMNSKYGGNA